MSFYAHVKGSKPMRRPLLPRNTIPWACKCSHEEQDKRNPGYLVKCIDCGTSRP